MGALKGAVNAQSAELGLYICGGRGKHSRNTPAELLAIADKTGLDAQTLIHSSRLAAKVDNTAIQDGYQLYLHSFVLSREGSWTVVQQGMNDAERMARRYHWHSPDIKSFTETPHSFIYGQQGAPILNLTDTGALSTKERILDITREHPERIMAELQQLIMPSHHDVRAEDIDLKRLGAVLATAYEQQIRDTESLLLLEGLGPRTLQSLTLVSEIVYGTPSRFEDPARYSFAHGGKDGHPFPVPVKVYDESISFMDKVVQASRMGHNDKKMALTNLHKAAMNLEKDFIPNDNFDQLIQKERNDSWKYGGRTVFGKEKRPTAKGVQLRLF